MYRKFPRPVKRIVIKIGSSVIATYRMKPRLAHLRDLVQQICALQKKGIEVVLVSSGAIVYGLGELNKKKRPQELSKLQAISAIGQTVLMNKYDRFFKANKKKCAQVLLTWDDFSKRTRYLNARNTFCAMFDYGIVPIVNENDTISTDEIKFGDNDKLSAMVASLIDADLLVILSDVEGLYDLNSTEKKVFEEIKEITQEIESVASGTLKKEMSKGGMTAKLQAIKIASHAKVPCIIANGESENVLLRILKGERLGTFFVEKSEKLIARKHWISFGSKPKGKVFIDAGAKKALLKGGVSLLLPGIISAEGRFNKGDVVVVYDDQKSEIARGMINYTIEDLKNAGRQKGKLEAIHCDNLVLSSR